MVVVAAMLAVVWVLRGGDEPGELAAAEVLPADAEVVRYLDRAGAARQLGLGTDVDEYLAALQDAPWIATPLATTVALSEDAPFGELDVDWWASVEVDVGEGAPLNVYRLDDDVDLGAVADALADAGLEESTLGRHRRFKVGPDVPIDETGMVDGIPVQGLADVTVLEEDHLLVVGAEPERVVDVVEGDADALADQDGLAALTDRTGAPLYAVAFLGAEALCDQQVELLGSSTTPEIAERLMDSGMGDLGSPDARGLFVVADGDGVRTEAVLWFPSDDEAADDAKARQAWLVDGIDPLTNQRYADLLDSGNVEADADLVVVDAGREPGLAVQVSDNGFGPLACS